MKPLELPMAKNLKLLSTFGQTLEESDLYKKLVRKLIYLTIPMPYITYSVQLLN